MEDLSGKTAVVTGAGSGIGRGIALACADAGMHVVLADLDAPAAQAVAREVEAKEVRALALEVDVSERASVQALAERACTEFGAVQLLCNNAGVLSVRPLMETTDDDWDWLLGINLRGVVHGVQAFVPRMRSQGGGAHIVNTGSVAGLYPVPASMGLGVYTVSKYGVVAFSETLRAELAPEGIGVSVLCPGGVSTRIGEGERSRPLRFGGPNPAQLLGGSGIQGMDPEEVGRIVVRGVRADRAYILTHPDTRTGVEERFRAILEDYDFAAR